VLIQTYKTIENIYNNIENIEKKRVQKLLLDSKDNAYMSLKLVTLRTDVYNSLPFDRYEKVINPFEKIKDELVTYEMESFLKNKDIVKKENKLIFNAICLDTKDKLKTVLSKIPKKTIIAFDTETTGLNDREDTLVGFSFCFNKKETYYVPLAHNYLGVGEQLSKEDAKEALEVLFSYKIVGQNLKFDLKFVEKFLNKKNLPIENDTMILAWLIDSTRSVGLDKLSYFYFDHKMIAYKDTVKKGETFASVYIEDATQYAGEDAFITYLLYYRLLEEFENLDIQKLLNNARDLEIPILKVLQKMEQNGIKVDNSFLEDFKKEVEVDLNQLTQAIYTIAGHKFNINSTKQLGVVLFDELDLQIIKKTKTGYSTDEKVLNALKDDHEIIVKLLEYRELFKLFSTYIKPLLALSKLNDDHKIFTSFIQTGTATGRLSSKDPNLQNIPAKSNYGKKIREGFIAQEGNIFIGIDYSQIELRLLAHFSEDEVLLKAFNNNEDIHLATATKLFGTEAKEKRHIAKTVNFGLLYGMGSKKLSQTLDISAKEAKIIIDNYFLAFKSIKAYMKTIEEKTEELGYSETLLGRRRYFDFENANGMQLAAFKRESVNAVFQGSAADLIKLSMLEIDNLIQKNNLEAKILLQIHDELIFEVAKEKADEYKNIFENIMKNIVKLKVPLDCSVNIGYAWGDLK
jgi:DNA polymerase-1